MVEQDWPVFKIRVMLEDRRAHLILLRKALEDKSERRRDKNRAIASERFLRMSQGKRKLRRAPKPRPPSREYWKRVLQYRGEIAMLEAGLASASSAEAFERAIRLACREVNVTFNTVEVRYFQRGLEKQFLALLSLVSPEGRRQEDRAVLRSRQNTSLGWRVRAKEPVRVDQVSGLLFEEWEQNLEGSEILYQRVRVRALRDHIHHLGLWEIELASRSRVRASDRDRVWARGVVMLRLFEETVRKIDYRDLREAMARVRVKYSLQKELITGERNEDDLWRESCDDIEVRLDAYIQGASLKKMFRKTRSSSKEYPKAKPKDELAKNGTK